MSVKSRRKGINHDIRFALVLVELVLSILTVMQGNGSVNKKPVI